MRVHVEEIPVGVGLEERIDGVPEPGAVKFNELADRLGINDPVQVGNQADVVGCNLFGKINLGRGLGRGDEAGAPGDAGDIQLELFGIVGKLHQLAAKNALFTASVGDDLELMLHRLAPFLQSNGKEGFCEVLFRSERDAVIAIVAALPGEHMPYLVLNGIDAFLEVHLHGHIQRFVRLREIPPAGGIFKRALYTQGIKFSGDHTLGTKEFLVLIAVQTAAFGGRKALPHNHDTVLHVRRPGHGVVDNKTLLAGFVPAVPDGFSGDDVGTESLGGILVVQGLPFMVIIVVLDAVRTGIGPGANGGPGRRRHRGQVIALGDIAPFLHEAAEIVEAAFIKHLHETFGNETVITEQGSTFRFWGHCRSPCPMS